MCSFSKVDLDIIGSDLIGSDWGNGGVGGRGGSSKTSYGSSIVAPHPATMANGRFTILDVGRQSVHLALARRRYFLVLLSTFITALLLIQGVNDYVVYTARARRSLVVRHDKAAVASCVDNILTPWAKAAILKNLTDSQQEDFYKRSLVNCTMFKTPAESWGNYMFINGTLTYKTNTGFVLPADPGTTHSNVASALNLLSLMLEIWGLVGVAWGLHAATTATPSYNTRPLQHRHAMSTGPEKLADLFREEFSGRVFRGIIRVAYTKIMADILFIRPTEYLAAMVRALIAGRSLKSLNNVTSYLQTRLWAFANPLQLLLVLCDSVAALEPGMWGFKALWRAIQLTRGTAWNTLLIHMLLSVWEWPWTYIVTVPQKPSESIVGLLRSIARSSICAMSLLPRFFLAPAFYILSKSWRDKMATMA